MDKHNVRLAGTKLGKAILEMLEDRIATVIEHYQDANASGKPSKVKLEVQIIPDEAREQYTFAVAGTVGLSPRNTFSTHLYAGLTPEGVEVVEFNPRQLRLPGTVEVLDTTTGEVTTHPRE